MKKNTKQQVSYWLKKHPSLKDDDNRLCANIWAEELTALGYGAIETQAFEFLRLYSFNKLTSAPSIKRARAKLQEDQPEMRGVKYNHRKGILQDKWLIKLGYKNGQ
jgi:hypothetical protein